ncbi:MAG: hypothetical protein Q9207_000209 [Kuettlingeria erythrocarpa]
MSSSSFSITSYLASIPRNTSASIQRLTAYGWLRLILVVAAYLLIRPYLMKLAARGQNRAHDQVLAMHGPPETVGGRAREDDEETGAGAGRSSGSDGGAEGKDGGKDGMGRRGKGKRGMEEELAKGVAMEDVDEDVEFLKRYCVERGQ